MTLPSASAVGKAVLMTAISVAILRVAVKPFVPAKVQAFLP